jgi:short subunit dehydrogenase-like uncharacterized protein
VHTILVYGSYGHTGRFIVNELIDKGFRPILSGRSASKLKSASAAHRNVEFRAAPLGDAIAMDRAFKGVDAVINAAGPFAFTAAPVIAAAVRAGVHYLDVAAEPDVSASTITGENERARAAGIAIVPSTGFYGGLGNLLATVAMGDWPEADEITLAFSLSSWKPTQGTRATIEAGASRRDGRRMVFVNGNLELRGDAAPISEWNFPSPVGRQTVLGEFTTADCLTISRHLRTRAIKEYMTLAPLDDLSDPDLAPPQAVDARGRSAQTFLLEAVVRSGASERRAVARGQDIYAVSAPLVVEAARRLLSEPRRWRGIVTEAELGDARSYLTALTPDHLEFEAPS